MAGERSRDGSQRGWLIRRFRGVYQVGPVAAPHGREMAAVLACRRRSGAEPRFGGRDLGLRRAREGDVHVTVTRRRDASRQGVRVHRSLSLDAVVHNGLPLTTPARTLHDLANRRDEPASSIAPESRRTSWAS